VLSTRPAEDRVSAWMSIDDGVSINGRFASLVRIDIAFS